MKRPSIALALLALTLPASAQLDVEPIASIPAPGSLPRFGRSLDVEGDLMVVGSLGDVTVYARIGNSWVVEASLSENNTLGYGVDVALDGTTLAVAATRTDLSIDRAGTVFVYTRIGTLWALEQQLTVSTAVAERSTASAVDLDGDRLVLGTSGHFSTCLNGNPFCQSHGSAFVFERTAGVWSETERLQPSPAPGNQRFGANVVLDGDRIVVATLPFTAEVQAYVFEFMPGGWTNTQTLDLNGVGLPGLRRPGLDLEGSRLAVGTPSVSGDQIPVRLYQSTGGVWNLEQSLSPSDGVASAGYGSSIQLDGTRLAIGAMAGDAAWLLELGPGGWQESARVEAPAGSPGDGFGHEVGLTGDSLVVATYEDGSNDPGRVDVFEISASPHLSRCLGNGGVAPGCTSCPCANDAPASSGGGCTNTSLTSATLFASGTASLAADSLAFQLRGASPDSFGMLVAGQSLLPQQGPCPAGSGIAQVFFDGLRCTGTNVRRLGVRATDSLGMAPNGWSAPLASLGAAVGETRHFQVIYRDDDSLGCTTGQNTTNAISVTVQP